MNVKTKIFIILAVVITALMFVTNNALGAKPPIAYEVYKEGGKRLWYAPWIITYKTVEWTLCPNCQYANGRLECIGEGPNRCKLPTASFGGSINIGDNFYNEEIIYSICNDINEIVDKSISEGNADGSVSQKVILNTHNDKEMLVVFYTSWKNANTKTGDVKYILFINELP